MSQVGAIFSGTGSYLPERRLTNDERLFERHDPGSKLDHLVSQFGWIASQGREGGFFILIGRRA